MIYCPKCASTRLVRSYSQYSNFKFFDRYYMECVNCFHKFQTIEAFFCNESKDIDDEEIELLDMLYLHFLKKRNPNGNYPKNKKYDLNEILKEIEDE